MYAVINMNDIKCQNEILRRQRGQKKEGGGGLRERERGSMLGDCLE